MKTNSETQDRMSKILFHARLWLTIARVASVSVIAKLDAETVLSYIASEFPGGLAGFTAKI